MLNGFSSLMNHGKCQPHCRQRIVALIASFGISLWAQPAAAQVTIPSNIGTDLQFPNSSQQFFNRGYERLEQEISRLQKQPFTPEQPILRISQQLLDQIDLEDPRIRSRHEIEIRVLPIDPGQ